MITHVTDDNRADIVKKLKERIKKNCNDLLQFQTKLFNTTGPEKGLVLEMNFVYGLLEYIEKDDTFMQKYPYTPTYIITNKYIEIMYNSRYFKDPDSILKRFIYLAYHHGYEFGILLHDECFKGIVSIISELLYEDEVEKEEKEQGNNVK